VATFGEQTFNEAKEHADNEATRYGTKKNFAILGACLAVGVVVFVGVRIYQSINPSCQPGWTKMEGTIPVCVGPVGPLTIEVKAP